MKSQTPTTGAVALVSYRRLAEARRNARAAQRDLHHARQQALPLAPAAGAGLPCTRMAPCAWSLSESCPLIRAGAWRCSRTTPAQRCACSMPS
jgi:hypothetical protein